MSDRAHETCPHGNGERQYCLDCTRDDAKEVEASIESKIVAIRDGSCTYTADEIAVNLIEEAASLIMLDPNLLADYRGLDSATDENYSEVLSGIAEDAESALADAGYTVVWNDGFVIYKGLTEAESDYLGGF